MLPLRWRRRLLNVSYGSKVGGRVVVTLTVVVVVVVAQGGCGAGADKHQVGMTSQNYDKEEGRASEPMGGGGIASRRCVGCCDNEAAGGGQESTVHSPQ